MTRKNNRYFKWLRKTSNYPITVYLFNWGVISFYRLKKAYLSRKISKFETLTYWLEKISPKHREIKKKIDQNQRKVIGMKMDLGKVQNNIQRHEYGKK